MNKYITMLIAIFTVSMISADLYRTKNGQWYSKNKKTGKPEYISSGDDSSGSPYLERHYPYQRVSDYPSFGSDRTTSAANIITSDKDMGNNR